MDEGLVLGLRSRGADVMTAQEAKMLSRDDEDQLRWASDQGRLLYSFNKADYYRIHEAWTSSGREHAGIILAQQRLYTAGEQMRRLMRILESETAESMRNRVEFLSQWGAR